MKEKELEFMEKKAKEIRCLILEMIGTLGVGHIGGSLSIVEALVVLYYKVMKIDPKKPDWVARDRFVLSKGHGGPSLYAVLADKGYFPKDWIYTLNQPETFLPSHCDRLKTPGVDMTAGSLGQGLSAALGMAIASKIDKSDVKVYAIIGDGESQEGQIWEAAMLAGQYKLDNLLVMQDYNKMQIDGTTDEVNSLEPLDKKWEAFGWNVLSVNGHSIEEISEAIEKAQKIKNKPSMIILNTIKGKGAFFAEGKVSSHNMNISEEQWKKAVCDLNGSEVK